MYKLHTSGPELFSLKVKTWSKFKTRINIMVALFDGFKYWIWLYIFAIQTSMFNTHYHIITDIDY